MIARYLTLLSILLIAVQGRAQYILKTPDGKEVKLDRDGTWHFIGSKASKKYPRNTYVSRYRKFLIEYDSKFWYCDTVKDLAGGDARFYSVDEAINGGCKENRLSFGETNIDSLAKHGYRDLGQITNFTAYTEQVNGLAIRFYDLTLLSNKTKTLDRYIGFYYNSDSGAFQFYIGTQKSVFDEEYERIITLLRSFSRIK